MTPIERLKEAAKITAGFYLVLILFIGNTVLFSVIMVLSGVPENIATVISSLVAGFIAMTALFYMIG